MSSAGLQRHEENMEYWCDNIDPRLLEQNVAQVGGFIVDDTPAEHGRNLAHNAEELHHEQTLVDPSHAAYDEMMDLHPDLLDLDSSTPATQMSVYPNPGEPFSFQFQNAWNTPPSSLRAEADEFLPGSTWQPNNQFVALADGFSLPTLHPASHMHTSRQGLLTPDTMSNGQLSNARHETMLSPTRPNHPKDRAINTRIGTGQAPPTMPINMNGVPANMPAAENIPSWAGEAYSVSAVHNAAHLAPHTPSQAGRKSRATSVASTAGHGSFACDGAPGKPCGKRFMTKSVLTHHARCHKPTRHFCSICDSGWYYMKDLERHMKTHAPRDRHLICNNNGCKYRTQPFSREDHRKRHEQNCRYSQQ